MVERMQGTPFNEGPLVLRWVAFLMVLAGIGFVLAAAPFAVLVLASIADGSDSGSSSDAGVYSSHADPKADDPCSGSSGYVDEIAGMSDVRVLGPSGDDYDIQRRGQLGTTVEGCGAYTWVMLTVKGHAPIPMVPVLRVRIGDDGPVCTTGDDGWWFHSDWDQATNVSYPTLSCAEHVPLGELEAVEAVSLR